jgi:hypothetical protein
MRKASGYVETALNDSNLKIPKEKCRRSRLGLNSIAKKDVNDVLRSQMLEEERNQK